MGGGGGKIEAPRLAGIQLQTSSYGRPIPIIYGQARIAGELIWYSDFTAHKHTESTDAGKGGGAPKQVNYTYTAAIIMAICEGPIVDLLRVWTDKETGAALSDYGFIVRRGDREAAPWGWLATAHPDKALGYAGTACACAQVIDLGTDASLRNYSFEVRGFASIADGNPGSPDAHPADILSDLLSNPIYGLGFDSSRIGDLTTYRTYVTAAGLWLSPAITDQRAVSDHLTELLQATNSEAVWSGGELKVIPYGDQDITANGATYAPDTTPVYDLDYDDFIVARGGQAGGSAQDPVKCERLTQADTYNVIPITFLQRSRNYVESVAEDPDNADVEAFGLRKGEPVEMRSIAREIHATAISRMLVKRSLFCRNKYTFTLGWKYALLEPMDFVSLTDDHLGIDHRLVRISEINENEDGELEVTAIEWPLGVGHAEGFVTEVPEEDGEVAPGNTGATIMNAPALYGDPGPAVLVALDGGENWGGCDVWVSDTGGDSYEKLATVSLPAQRGALASALPAWGVSTDPDADNPHLDTVNPVDAQLVVGSGPVRTVTTRQRDSMLSAHWVGGEIVSYERSVLSGTSRYRLSGLQRGCYGTEPEGHDTGTALVGLTDRVIRQEIDRAWDGRTLYFKFPAFNTLGRGKQDLTDVTPVEHVVEVLKPPRPQTCTLAVSTSAPGIAARTRRHLLFETQDGLVLTDGTLIANARKWLTCEWTHAKPIPESLLTGFRVVFYRSDSDGPDDESGYIAPPVTVAPGIRGVILAVSSPDESFTAVSAVKALYTQDRESDWRTSDGSEVATDSQQVGFGGEQPELLPDPDFELIDSFSGNQISENYWVTTGTSANVREQTIVYSGSNSVHLARTAPPGTWVLETNGSVQTGQFTLDAGRSYRLRFRIRVPTSKLGTGDFGVLLFSGTSHLRPDGSWGPENFEVPGEHYSRIFHITNVDQWLSLSCAFNTASPGFPGESALVVLMVEGFADTFDQGQYVSPTEVYLDGFSLKAI